MQGIGGFFEVKASCRGIQVGDEFHAHFWNPAQALADGDGDLLRYQIMDGKVSRRKEAST